MLVLEDKLHAVVHHRLSAEDIREVFRADVDVGEYLQVGLPVYFGSGSSVATGLLESALVLGHVESLFEAQGVVPLTAAALYLHVLAGELGSAESQTVKSQREGIVSAGVVVVLTSGVQRAERQLPVVLFLSLVEIYRDTAAEILDGYGLISVQRDDYALSVALARLVDGVRDYLEHRVAAAVNAVRAENYTRAQTDLVRSLQRHKVVVIVFLCHLCISCLPQ